MDSNHISISPSTIAGSTVTVTAATSEQWKFCPFCGREFGELDKYCAQCGKQRSAATIAYPHIWPQLPYTYYYTYTSPWWGSNQPYC